MVIRSPNGEFIAAESNWHSNITDVLMIEALAARDGAKLAATKLLQTSSPEVG